MLLLLLQELLIATYEKLTGLFQEHITHQNQHTCIILLSFGALETVEIYYKYLSLFKNWLKRLSVDHCLNHENLIQSPSFWKTTHRKEWWDSEQFADMIWSFVLRIHIWSHCLVTILCKYISVLFTCCFGFCQKVRFKYPFALEVDVCFCNHDTPYICVLYVYICMEVSHYSLPLCLSCTIHQNIGLWFAAKKTACLDFFCFEVLDLWPGFVCIPICHYSLAFIKSRAKCLFLLHCWE